MPRSKAWVIKLGGSLASSPALPEWLTMLAASPVPCLVVPGGGPYADVVRDLQARWRFADVTAHALAILAMGLYGRTLVALAPRLRLAASLAEATALVDSAAGAAVWCPSEADLTALTGLPADWSVTSDSLALWLAGRCGVRRLGLVKSCAAGGRTLERLAHDGAVDGCFARLAGTLAVEVAWFEAQDWARAGRILGGVAPMRSIR